MRYVLLGLCALATACAGSTPTAPSSASVALGAASASSARAADSAVTQAPGDPGSPIKGDLDAYESVDGSLHHLVGTGHGTHLGNFTYTADITVDDATGDGAGTVAWTAANGDRIVATTKGRILVADFPNNRITVGETQIITGGTGRFESASGTITVERSLDLSTGLTKGAFAGTIALGR